MLILKISFYLITLLSYGTADKKDIIIIGKAENAKAGAMVVSKSDNKGYYIAGIASWDERIVGKTIKVQGKLFIEEFKKQPEGEPITQHMVGIKRTLLRPKWDLVR
jgi:hypothetical protein